LNILIIGAGAIGCLVGAKLAASGYCVTLVGRPAFADAVRNRGILLHEGDTTATVRNVAAMGSLAAAFAAADDPYAIAILTVKSYDTQTVLAELSSLALADLPPLVSLQNGVGNEEMIAAVLGADKVIAGTITTPVSVLGPGEIRSERPSHRIGLSAWSPGEAALVDRVAAALIAAGLRVTRYPSPAGMKWTKLLMNMVGNATCAILDETPAVVFADPRLVDLELAAWREALAVMQRAGIQPVNLGKYPFRWLSPLIRTLPNGLLRPLLRRQVAGARGEKMPSLHIDLSSGKGRSEIGWLNGAVVKMGQTMNVPTPINQGLTRILLSLVAEPSDREVWRHNHARLLDSIND
jgi:2-dehydropantoate 2-reductase